MSSALADDYDYEIQEDFDVAYDRAQQQYEEDLRKFQREQFKKWMVTIGLTVLAVLAVIAGLSVGLTLTGSDDTDTTLQTKSTTTTTISTTSTTLPTTNPRVEGNGNIRGQFIPLLQIVYGQTWNVRGISGLYL